MTIIRGGMRGLLPHVGTERVRGTVRLGPNSSAQRGITILRGHDAIRKSGVQVIRKLSLYPCLVVLSEARWSVLQAPTCSEYAHPGESVRPRR